MLKKGESGLLIGRNNRVSSKKCFKSEESVKKSKRGRKRKNELTDSEYLDSPLQFPLYVPQRKSAKKASISISKSFEGFKKYKQQDIGIFVQRDRKSKESDGGIKFETTVDTRELMDDIDMLLKDTDDEDEKLGLDITYDNNSSFDIIDIQENIEFSDSDGEEGNVLAVYSMKVQGGSEIDDEGKDLLEIQHGIAFSDSDEENSE